MVAITFNQIGQIVHLWTIWVSLASIHTTANTLNRVRRKVQYAGNGTSGVLRKEVLLTANGKSDFLDWSGKTESTCKDFTSIEDFFSSDCTSREYASVIQTGLNGSSISNQTVWVPCGDQICIKIYRVGSSTKVTQIGVSGWVDSKAEILVFAEFSVAKGDLFQIGKLRAKTGSEKSLQRVQFNYFREEHLDISQINVTLVRNGGLTLMDTFEIALEGSNQTTTPAPVPPRSNNVILDVRKHMAKNEWIQIDCHYTEYYEDFWTYGCPVNADANYLPPSMGFWYPCRDPACSFMYNGAQHEEPLEVIINGYFQGGETVLYGKQSLLAGAHYWRLLARKSFHNSTDKVIRFNLASICNVNVLLIAINNGDKDSVMLVGKVEVVVQPHNNPKECHILSHDEASNAEIISVPPLIHLAEFLLLTTVFYYLKC